MGSATYFQSYRFGKRTVVCRRLIYFREKDGEIARLSAFSVEVFDAHFLHNKGYGTSRKGLS